MKENNTMVILVFTAVALGVGVGMGTVVAKHLATRKAPYQFQWKGKRYEVRELD